MINSNFKVRNTKKKFKMELFNADIEELINEVGIFKVYSILHENLDNVVELINKCSIPIAEADKIVKSRDV